MFLERKIDRFDDFVSTNYQKLFLIKTLMRNVPWFNGFKGLIDYFSKFILFEIYLSRCIFFLLFFKGKKFIRKFFFKIYLSEYLFYFLK